MFALLFMRVRSTVHFCHRICRIGWVGQIHIIFSEPSRVVPHFKTEDTIESKCVSRHVQLLLSCQVYNYYWMNENCVCLVLAITPTVTHLLLCARCKVEPMIFFAFLTRGTWEDQYFSCICTLNTVKPGEKLTWFCSKVIFFLIKQTRYDPLNEL